MKTPTIPCCHCKGTGREPDQVAIGAVFRKQRGSLSLTEVAKRMNRSIGYISDLEHGRKNWNPGITAAYENALKDEFVTVSVTNQLSQK